VEHVVRVRVFERARDLATDAERVRHRQLTVAFQPVAE
jgi:hypothetical protein